MEANPVQFSVLPVPMLVIVFMVLAGGSQTGWAASIDQGHQEYLHDFPVDDPGSFHSNYPAVLILGSIVAVVCVVLVIFGCLDICPRQSAFKDFDNEAFSDEAIPIPPGASSDFTMYPPVENTPDSVSAMPVFFEPLPDVTARLQPAHAEGANLHRLRPKVTQDTREHMDSEESLDEAVHRDNIQQKMKLQNLITNSRHQLPRSQLQYIKELGNGWFGKVLQGEGLGILPGHKKTKVVVQMLKEDSSSQDQLAFLEEAIPYRDMDHPNVLKMFGQCVDTAPFLTVLELCPFGDLKTYLRSHRVAMDSFNEKGLPLKFACDMAAGLQALHQENFIHRDFATRNCLLASDLAVKIGDYGLSEETFKDDYYFDNNGDAIPVRWLAPETMVVMDNGVTLRRITKDSNIWSYGVALWEVVTFGSMPYGDLTNDHVLRLVVQERCMKLPKPDVDTPYRERLYQLMQMCWSEPGERPSLRELRIMLLHLLARKSETDSSAFEQKWNQLMPRRSPKIARVGGATPYPGTVTSLGQGGQTGRIQTVAGSGSAMVEPQKVSPISHPGTTPVGGATLDLNQLSVSKLGLAGSISSTPKVSMGSEEKPSKSPSNPHDLTTPINELSLEAEFSRANAKANRDSDSDSSLFDVSSQESETLEKADKKPETVSMDESTKKKKVPTATLR